MSKLEALKKITSKPELANLLGLKPSTLTYTLYKESRESQYYQFRIPKRNGGVRLITAPDDRLKLVQSKLSTLLLDCVDEINKVKFPKPNVKRSTLSHGFVRERSIMTNALLHINKKNVLNIDLSDFFDSFNFGRVRGFFIHNKNFQLRPEIATVIAQIASCDNKLPQGSPCSPVITNLITHSLDIRLASLAKKHSCTYSRYADDLTFSTSKTIFPEQILKQEEGEYIPGKKLRNEITRAGFSINDRKTRVQYSDSRQDVTGLVVNKKPNIKKEYWRTVKSQCHSLFTTGEFFKKGEDGEVVGNINELEGQLNFIDQVDRFNRLRAKEPINPEYQIASYGINTKPLLSGREKTFSKFLYYRAFYGNDKPTILCEGHTDNIYLKSAINRLAKSYPRLAEIKGDEYKLLVHFFKYSKRSRFLLQLYGGTSYLSYFITNFAANYAFYKASRPEHPVIIVLDNDDGFGAKKDNGIHGKLKKLDSVTVYPTKIGKSKLRQADFIHVAHNLYIVLTPLTKKGKNTDIESLFDDNARLIKYRGKYFNTVDKRNADIDLSKDSFANHVVKEKKGSINFDGFRPLLERITAAISHYDSIK